MLKKDLRRRNALRLSGQTHEEILPMGGFGAVLARAGVGKTALLVQLALDFLLKDKNVLHISLNDPVNKVSLWYQEVFRHLSDGYDNEQIKEAWEQLLPNRFIMTFKVEGFSVPKLEERLTDLTEQNIFTPQMILIDGLPFDASTRQIMSEFKTLAAKQNVQMWFTVTTHRHEETHPDGMPNQLKDVAELFEVVVQLQPDGKEIHVIPIKGREDGPSDKPLVLDPSTMLLKKND
jgi:KaiC/GvpD/RAD55 family RecA-like ATPase